MINKIGRAQAGVQFVNTITKRTERHKVLLPINHNLRHHQAQFQGHNQNDQFIGIPLNIQRYRKTVSAALSVQLALVACYLPYVFLLFFPSLIPLSESAQILGRRYTTSIVFVNSSLNPFLYCRKIRGVRKAVKESLTQLLDSMICCH